MKTSEIVDAIEALVEAKVTVILAERENSATWLGRQCDGGASTEQYALLRRSSEELVALLEPERVEG